MLVILQLLLLGAPGVRAAAVAGVSVVVRAPGLLRERTLSSGAAVVVAGAAVTVAGATLSPVVAATTGGGSATVLSAWRRSRSAGCGGGMYRPCRVIPPLSAMRPSEGGDEGMSGGS